jgi:hypothetical protein
MRRGDRPVTYSGWGTSLSRWTLSDLGTVMRQRPVDYLRARLPPCWTRVFSRATWARHLQGQVVERQRVRRSRLRLRCHAEHQTPSYYAVVPSPPPKPQFERSSRVRATPDHGARSCPSKSVMKPPDPALADRFCVGRSAAIARRVRGGFNEADRRCSPDSTGPEWHLAPAVPAYRKPRFPRGELLFSASNSRWRWPKTPAAIRFRRSRWKWSAAGFDRPLCHRRSERRVVERTG